MKNITITVDEHLYELARKSPEVQKSSLSGYVVKLLRQDLERSREQIAQRMLDSIEAAAKAKATSDPLVWDRDSIYER